MKVAGLKLARAGGGKARAFVEGAPVTPPVTPTPTFAESLDFADARNSQFAPVLAL